MRCPVLEGSITDLSGIAGDKACKILEEIATCPYQELHLPTLKATICAEWRRVFTQIWVSDCFLAGRQSVFAESKSKRRVPIRRSSAWWFSSFRQLSVCKDDAVRHPPEASARFRRDNSKTLRAARSVRASAPPREKFLARALWRGPPHAGGAGKS